MTAPLPAADLARLVAHLRRVIGEHVAPSDCYSTGPQFGDERDLTCPSCDALAYLAALSPSPEVGT